MVWKKMWGPQGPHIWLYQTHTHWSIFLEDEDNHQMYGTWITIKKWTATENQENKMDGAENDERNPKGNIKYHDHNLVVGDEGIHEVQGMT